MLNSVSVREEDDGRRTAGKGIMLKGFEISTMCARIDDVRMQFTEQDTSLAAVNVKLDNSNAVIIVENRGPSYPEPSCRHLHVK